MCTSNRDYRKLENTVKQSWFKHLGELHKESSVYCIYFIIQNIYIFCLLIHIPRASRVRYFCDWICGFSVRGHPLASSMNEKDIPPRLNPVLD